MAFKVDQIKNEILRYVATKPEVLQAALLSDAVILHKHAKTIRKVKGEYPSIQALISHVVQTFYSKKFTPYGEISFYKNSLRSFRQKVDFQFDPADVLGTVLEDEYEEKKNRDQMSISQRAIEMLKAKIIDDVNLLSMIGVYDPASIGKDNPVFGTSMNGLNKVLEDAKADTTNPVFSVPGSTVTSNNALEVMTNFEKSLPDYIRTKISRVFVDANFADDYLIEYEDTFGQNKFQNSNSTTRLRKWEIVALPNLTPGTIFATTDNNLLELIDDRENPAEISDVQVDKRIVNVLGEFSLGYGFALNQAVFMHTDDASKSLGLNDNTQNQLFFPQTFK